MNSKISTAWRIAAADLDVRVVAPFETKSASGELVRCEAYLPDFGSLTGAIVLSYDATDHLRTELTARWNSILFGSYETYDRALFVDTLNDWGWFGRASEAPEWYTGAQ